MIDAVELGGFDQRQERSRAFPTFVATGEQPILATECDWPDRWFGGIVVDLDGAVVQEAAERWPTGQRTECLYHGH